MDLYHILSNQHWQQCLSLLDKICPYVQKLHLYFSWFFNFLKEDALAIFAFGWVAIEVWMYAIEACMQAIVTGITPSAAKVSAIKFHHHIILTLVFKDLSNCPFTIS
jgi:hypothetical protein